MQDILKQLHCHKKFVIRVDIQTTQQKIVKLEAKAAHREDKYHLIRSQKTNPAAHFSQSRQS